MKTTEEIVAEFDSSFSQVDWGEHPSCENSKKHRDSVKSFIKKALQEQREEVEKELIGEIERCLDVLTISEKLPKVGLRKTIINPIMFAKLVTAKMFDK